MVDRIKVFFISAANSIHTVRWVNALSEKFEIHLIYCKGHKTEIDKISNNVILHELKYSAPFGYYLNAIQLKKLFKMESPSVINVHYASGYGTLARIAKLPNVILSVWGSDVYDFPNESIIKKKILERNLKFANSLCSTSNIMANEVRRIYPKLDKKIYITPFGVDIEKFKKINVERKDEDFNIGIVKTLSENYGIRYAIIAIKLLKEKLKNDNKGDIADSIKLYIYGDGPERAMLNDLIKEESLLHSVFLKGRISNDKVPEVLNSIDIFCATSINESFGVAVIEAMACELPVVATKADGFCEVMDNEITGYLVEKMDSNAICLAIEKLLNDKKLGIAFGKNARKKVLENYDWKSNVENISKIYVEISKLGKALT